MPTKRVLDLAAVTSMANNDLLYVVRSSEPTPADYDKKITWANVLAGLDTRYLPKTFASPQVLTFTGQSQFTFTGAGNFVATDLVGSNAIMLLPNTKQVRFNDNLLDGSASGTYTWALPGASGTLALTSQIPSVPVTSVFGRTGAITAQSGDYSTFYQPLDAELTALSALSGTSGLIRRTGSSFVYDNAAYITASALAGYATESWVNAGFVSLSGSYSNPSWITSLAWAKITGAPTIPVGSDYIAKNGTTTTTATIPFANGISVTGLNADSSAIRIPDGSWIRPQTAGQALYITRGSNPGVQNGAILLETGGVIINHGDGTNALSRIELGNATAGFYAQGVGTAYLDYLTLGTNNVQLRADNGAGLDVLAATTTLLSTGGTNIILAGGANVTYNAITHHNFKWGGSATPPTGTQAYLLGIDASGNLIQGSAGSGYMTLSGHNDLTTPWSFGDGASFAASSAGLQVDPVGTYGMHLKGNILVEQSVSQALSLYRPVTSGEVCLSYQGWDSLGAQSEYARICAELVSSTAGAVTGGLDFKVAIAGVLTDVLQLRQAGSTLTGGLTASGTVTVETNASDVGFYSRASGSAGIIGGIFVGRGQRGTIASPTATQSGDGLLWLGGQGYGATGFSSGSRAVIRARASENWTDTAQGAYLSFETTATGGTTRTERGRVEADGALTWLSKINTPASVSGSASLNIPTGVAVTSPVTGDFWSPSADTLNWRSGANTRTVALREASQTFAGTQTFNIITATNTITGRQLAQTRQTSATTTGAITWTLTSGGTMDLTGTLTGGVTMNISAPAAGAWSALFATQGATPQTITLSLTGVSWILTGANGLTGTNTIVIPTAAFVASKSACIQIYWSTTTRAYVTVT